MSVGDRPISTSVFIAVLLSAALHASWNMMLKIRLEPFLAMVLINLGCGIVCLPLLAITGLPRAEAWPWLVGSCTIHIGYYIALSNAYARGDLGQIYPVARGSAPALTTIVSVLILGETVSAVALSGIVLIATGILTMAIPRASTSAVDPQGLAWAGLTAVTISVYTIVDGWGARASGDAIAYAATLFVAEGVVFTLVAIGMRGLRGLAPLVGFVVPGLAGGTMAAGSYAVAIWAMTQAPVPLVAALRETSVLFGAILGVLILCGLVAIRLA